MLRHKVNEQVVLPIILFLSVLCLFLACGCQAHRDETDNAQSQEPSVTNDDLQKYGALQSLLLNNALVLNTTVELYENSYASASALDCRRVGCVVFGENSDYRYSYCYPSYRRLNVSLENERMGWLWTSLLRQSELDDWINSANEERQLNPPPIALDSDIWLRIWTIAKTYWDYLHFLDEYLYNGLMAPDELEDACKHLERYWGFTLDPDLPEPLILSCSFPVENATLLFKLRYGGEVVFSGTTQFTTFQGQVYSPFQFELQF